MLVCLIVMMMNCRVNRAPLLMATPGTDPQTKTLAEMTQLIKNSLKKPLREKLAERSDLSWVGTRSRNLTALLLPEMIIPLPVPQPYPPGRSLSNCLWMSGCAGNWRSSTSPWQKATPPECLKLPVYREISSSQP